MIALVLLVAVQGASAARTCGYDFYGRYRCSGLSNAARLGIGIGIAALSILTLFFLIMLRRRRISRANEAFISHPNTGRYQQEYQPYPQQGQYQPQPSYDPSYAQPNHHNQAGAWNSGAPMNSYPMNQQSQYAPPAAEALLCRPAVPLRLVIYSCLFASMSELSDPYGPDVDLPHGYKLKSILQDHTLPSDKKHAPDLTNAVFFPWHQASLQTLWGGKRVTTWAETAEARRRPVLGTLPIGESASVQEVWTKTVRKWMGCAAICAGKELRLVQTRDQALRTVGHIKTSADDIQTVTWALDFDTLHPLVVFAGQSATIRVIDVESWERTGALTGHGGPITHVVTHPVRPDYILSTSHDWTARMWSLADPVDTIARPSYWPGQTLSTAHTAPARMKARHTRNVLSVEDIDLGQLNLQDSAGRELPPHALRTQTGPAGSVPDSKMGGHGKGVCVAVFKGTAASLGGHRTWVMCADFHPTKPFVATGGADRAIKIWRVPDFPTLDTQLDYGVKFDVVELPLFSTTHLHTGAVEFVRWINEDTLISKSRTASTHQADYYATIAWWRWLDLKRFAPDGYEPTEQQVMPSYHDYNESRSYVKISDLTLEHESDTNESEWKLDVCPAWPDLVIANETEVVHIVNMDQHLCKPKALAARKRILSDRRVRKSRTRHGDNSANIADVPHWRVKVGDSSKGSEFEILRAVVNPLDPRVLLGVGVNGIVALWHEESDR
ncbi:polycomb protein EED [Ceratobasidium sp. AG-Ba]|nr:polycomb protein EED [Ceratobasidium sp. AG-Ba]